MSGYSTTDTFASLVDEVLLNLGGISFLGDQMCTLTQTIDASTNSFTVDDTNVSRGVIEIDEELLYCTSASNGTLTVPAWGRGWKGTAAASHTTGAAVSIAPVYPRSVAARAVNNAIRSVFPDLFAITSLDTTVSADTWQYEIPAAAERILSVEWRWDTIEGWCLTNDWELTSSAYTTDFASGKFLSLGQSLPVGALLHVTYAKQPTLLSASSDAFATVTGLPATAREVVILGAAASLLPWIDVGKTPSATVPSDMTDQQRPIGASVQLARDLRQRYQERLIKERDALHARHPIRSHNVRG